MRKTANKKYVVNQQMKIKDFITYSLACPRNVNTNFAGPLFFKGLFIALSKVDIVPQRELNIWQEDMVSGYGRRYEKKKSF